MVLSGRNNKFDCSTFINNWSLLAHPPYTISVKSTAEESIHTVLQGRLLEIGKIRGFQTFCPNKSRRFNGLPLSNFSTLEQCPRLQFSEYDTLRQIDILWFRERGNNFIPECGFEVEISTGTWSGVGRLATLIDYTTTRLYVISDDEKKFHQAMSSFPEYGGRYKHIQTRFLGDLYAAEMGLRDLREKIGL